MNTPDEDYDAQEQNYELAQRDRLLLKAACELLSKVIKSDVARPVEVASAAMLLHVLKTAPRVVEDRHITVHVTSPRKRFGEIETYHWWSVAAEYGTLRLESGGHFYRPSTGGDTFTTMTWTVSPGNEPDFSDYQSHHRIVPDICSFQEGVERVDFFSGGFSIEVTDEANDLLEEAEYDETEGDDEVFSETEEVEGNEDDDLNDEDEHPPIEATVTPRDAIETKLAACIDWKVVETNEADYGHGAEQCNYCGTPTSDLGLYVDGMVGDGAWANMCASCFQRHGVGIGWGKGQLYARQKDSRWRLVAGFRPQD